MKKKDLTEIMRNIVLQHGIENVEQVLLEIRNPTERLSSRSGPSVACSKPRRKFTSDQRRKKKLTAARFVLKLENSLETKRLLEELANKYDNKEFLPTIGEIRNFCAIHGISIPTSFSRSVMVPRIFKHLSQLESEKIQFMLRTESFSGPTQLAPIAEAIRQSSNFRLNSPLGTQRPEKSARKRAERKQKSIPDRRLNQTIESSNNINRRSRESISK